MKHKKGKWRTFVIVLLILSMAMTPMQWFSVNSFAAKVQEKIIYTTNQCEVVFKVNSQWETGFEGQFIIYNKSDAPLENWRIKLNFQHEIASIWDGEIESHSGNKYVIKYPNWSPSIPSGGKAIIGFNGKGNGTIVPPTDCTVPGGTAETPKEDYTITYHTSSDWKDAFNGEISITNNTKKAIENWQLEFDFDKKVNQFWTAKLVSKDGNHYTIKHDDWNSIILPNQTIKLGFEAQPGPADTQPENYKLTKRKAEEEDKKEEIDYDTDTDGDGLEDYYEEIEGTDKNNPDTDGDGLSDFYEFSSRTNPLLADTNGNGIPDGEEDNDMDQLTNLEEFKLSTDSATDNTDDDGLGDSMEVEVYHTDPLKADTDGDGLLDGDEVLLNTNPLLADTNGNGIKDSEERIFQTLEYKVREKNITEIEKAEISMAVAGCIKKSTDIHNLYNISIFPSEVVGRVGVPIEFNSRREFDHATIKFTYNSAMEDSVVQQLGILYYNEKEDIYQLQNSTIDKENHTISMDITPSKLGIYIVINKEKWEEAWNHELKYQNSSLAVPKIDIAFVVDHSESMTEKRLSMIREGLTNFVDTLGNKDRGAVISFTAYNAAMKAELSKDKKLLNTKINELAIEKSRTRAVEPEDTINTGLEMAVNHLKEQNTKNGKLIVLFVDGDMKYSQDIIHLAKKSGIKLFVINAGKLAEFPNLKKMIQQMEGYFYDVDTSEDIFYSLENIDKILKTGIDTTDTDGDGLLDIYETEGMQLTNGQVETMDYKKADTDGDGLSDFEEMNGSRVTIVNEMDVLGKESANRKTVKLGNKQQQKTNKKVKRKDTDGDNISDKYDKRPRDFNINDIFIDKLKKLDSLVTQYCKEYSISSNKHDWYIAMFFRSFGKYYNTPNWKVLAGEIDNRFITYVKNKNIQLYRYFGKKKNQVLIGDENGKTIDLIHFGGAMSIQLHETSLDDSIKNLKDFKKLLGLAPEKYLNAMGGWAGDLQQVVWYIVEQDSELTSVGFENLRKEKKGFYDLTYYSIGADFAPFSTSDLLADIDVLMLDYLRTNEKTLITCFYEYFGKDRLYLNRINNFITHISRVDDLNSSIKETKKMRSIREENMRKQFVLDFTREEFHTVKWPFYNTKGVLIQEKDSIQVRNAFLNYLYDNREHYIQPFHLDN